MRRQRRSKDHFFVEYDANANHQQGRYISASEVDDSDDSDDEVDVVQTMKHPVAAKRTKKPRRLDYMSSSSTSSVMSSSPTPSSLAYSSSSSSSNSNSEAESHKGKLQYKRKRFEDSIVQRVSAQVTASMMQRQQELQKQQIPTTAPVQKIPVVFQQQPVAITAKIGARDDAAAAEEEEDTHDDNGGGDDQHQTVMFSKALWSSYYALNRMSDDIVQFYRDPINENGIFGVLLGEYERYYAFQREPFVQFAKNVAGLLHIGLDKLIKKPPVLRDVLTEFFPEKALRKGDLHAMQLSTRMLGALEKLTQAADEYDNSNESPATPPQPDQQHDADDQDTSIASLVKSRIGSRQKNHPVVGKRKRGDVGGALGELHRPLEAIKLAIGHIADNCNHNTSDDDECSDQDDDMTSSHVATCMNNVRNSMTKAASRTSQSGCNDPITVLLHQNRHVSSGLEKVEDLLSYQRVASQHQPTMIGAAPNRSRRSGGGDGGGAQQKKQQASAISQLQRQMQELANTVNQMSQSSTDEITNLKASLAALRQSGVEYAGGVVEDVRNRTAQLEQSILLLQQQSQDRAQQTGHDLVETKQNQETLFEHIRQLKKTVEQAGRVRSHVYDGMSGIWSGIVQTMLPRQRLEAQLRRITQPHNLGRIIYDDTLVASILWCHQQACFQGDQNDGIALYDLMFQKQNGVSQRFVDFVATHYESEEYSYNSRNRLRLRDGRTEYFANKDRLWYDEKLKQHKFIHKRTRYDPRTGLLRFYAASEMMPMSRPLVNPLSGFGFGFNSSSHLASSGPIPGRRTMLGGFL